MKAPEVVAGEVGAADRGIIRTADRAHNFPCGALTTKA